LYRSGSWRSAVQSGFFEELPNGLLAELRMFGALGVSCALLSEPAVRFGKAFDLRARTEQKIAEIADLILNLAFLPARRRRASDRFDQMMRAQLQEAAVRFSGPPDKDRLNCSPHVVIDPTPTDAAIEFEHLVVGVEDHLLGLAIICANKRHLAVSEADLRRFHRYQHALEFDALVAPNALIGFARILHIHAHAISRTVAASIGAGAW
jgi:hypothetical protein